MEVSLMLSQLGKGMVVSVEIFILTLVFSIPLGLFVALGRMSKLKILSGIVNIYIAIMRGTPLMLQLIVVYFAPYYVFRVPISNKFRFAATIIAFSINYAAYFGEIFRAGIQSIPVGQREAAKVLGYTKTQTFIRIILPQVIQRIIPPVTNETITLVKDTSLSFVLSVAEMFTIAKQIGASEASIMPLMIAGVFYFVFNYVVAFIMDRFEKKMSYFR